MEKFALIVAGGSGTRMGAEVPKQFLELGGRPILMHTLERFCEYDPGIHLVLVLPSMQFGYWHELVLRHRFNLKHRLVPGGATRFQSVRNGLQTLPAKGIVFIHDGVRPLVSKQTLERCETTALIRGNALPVMPVVESVREVEGEQSKHADRTRFRLVQTPQTFRLPMIKKAFEQPESPLFTDDASVAESFGEHINLVDGNAENIKITHPADLQIAALFLEKLAAENQR